MRQIPPTDALRILACEQEVRACTAEMANLAMQHEAITKQRDQAHAKAAALAASHRLDPNRHRLITVDSDKYPVGYVVDLKTGEPLPDEEPASQPNGHVTESAPTEQPS